MSLHYKTLTQAYAGCPILVCHGPVETGKTTDKVSDQAPLTPIVCKPASADPLVVDHTYTTSQVTETPQLRP